MKERLLGRTDEASVSVAMAERPFSFDGDGAAFQLTCEAKRIDLAFLFDPMMAVHTSNVDALPHQITAVYESMLPLLRTCSERPRGCRGAQKDYELTPSDVGHGPLPPWRDPLRSTVSQWYPPDTLLFTRFTANSPTVGESIAVLGTEAFWFIVGGRKITVTYECSNC
jgi:hypothetical protein